MKNNRTDAAAKRSLTDKLTAIILLETSKDYKEMNSGLVRECVDFLMELEGKENLTKKEIKERVESIPFKGKVTAVGSYAKKKLRAKRLAVVAAVLAALLAIFSIIAVSTGGAEDSIVDRYIKQIVEFMKGGDGLDFENIELIKPNDSKTYSSAQELVRDEKISILFPTWLPENEKITKCWYFEDETSGNKYIFQCQNPRYSMSVFFERAVSEKIKSESSIKFINGLNVYLISKDDVVQGEFEHNGYYYSIDANTEEALLKIIDNLKEIS